MRSRFLNLAAGGIVLAAFVSPATAQNLEETAELWGRMHGHAVYCNDTGAHDFGVKAIDFFKRKVGAGARLEALREKYGITFLNNTGKSPSGAAGGSCSQLRANMKEALQRMHP